MYKGNSSFTILIPSYCILILFALVMLEGLKLLDIFKYKIM